MPLIRLKQDNPLVDGRQSERALAVRVGVERYLTDFSYVTLPELTLPTGRRADLVALSPKGEILIIEVKSSVADFQADSKWQDYLDFCDRLWFATLPDVPPGIFPADVGFVIADRHGADLQRDCERRPVKPHIRKTVHLRFARTAAQRLTQAGQFLSDTSADAGG